MELVKKLRVGERISADIDGESRNYLCLKQYGPMTIFVEENCLTSLAEGEPIICFHVDKNCKVHKGTLDLDPALGVGGFQLTSDDPLYTEAVNMGRNDFFIATNKMTGAIN